MLSSGIVEVILLCNNEASAVLKPPAEELYPSAVP